MKFLSASVIALAVAMTPALADNHEMNRTAYPSADMGAMHDKLIRSRDITGGAVYTLNEADDEGWDPGVEYDAVGPNWNRIGEIEDLVLSRDGRVTGIVAEVGGFLDIGDKHVVISVDDLNLVAVDDASYAYVTWLNEEQLEELPGVDEGFWD